MRISDWSSDVCSSDLLTAGWRARFSHCLLFNPTDARSARYNPLLEVRRGEHEVRDVQNIADILVDPEGALERRNHWEKTSHSLLVGAILHILHAEEEDRKSVVSGKSVSVRVDLGGRRNIKKKNKINIHKK